MDIRKNYQFNTKVVKAEYIEKSNIWQLELDDGSTTSCRYLLTAVGPLSASRMPDIEGIDTFSGESFHSSRWPKDSEGNEISFEGKRVGVIGAGATGVQIIAEVGKTAKELFVFQRTPNWCTPLGNNPISSERMENIKQNYDNIFAYIKTTETAFPYHRHPKKGVDTSAEEREALFEELYNTPGYGIWLATYKDILLSERSNSYLAEFVANKIRARVDDPQVAEKLIPKDQPFGAKRVPMETNYYEIYNNQNVHLVDVLSEPIRRVTPNGIELDGKHYDLDVIIYATGFDAVTGAIDRIDIRGKDSVPLKEVWEDGPLTYLGLQTRGFPNFFTLVGPHNGAAFCNIAVCGGLQVDWVSKMLRDMRARNLTFCEPEEAAQAKWTDDVYKELERTLMAKGDAWWVKVTTHPNGEVTRRSLAYLSGGDQYRKVCDQVAYYNYQGFSMK
jgi:cyclohexanone monooxygenase